ncbi:MAG: hypothetical protein KAK00_00550 [Nanoarchaeota archaeon]|nr:hypothetical protein [Nanoarchaeota archaeon]
MIQICNLKDGFETTDPKMSLLIWKYRYFKAGIPCHMFRQEQKRDILDIIAIDNAFNEKSEREAEISALMGKIKSGM